MEEKLWMEMQEKVQFTAVKSYREGLVAGTSGNVSYFDHENGVMAITASNLDYNIMLPEDVVLMKLDGTILKGQHKPSSEWQMHAEIYKAREDVNAIIHTHGPHATGFAVTHQEIPLVLVEMLPFIGGSIPLAKFALPGTPELGKECVKALETRNACLMENHGVVAIGKSLEQAYLRAVYVEDAAKIYFYAKQVGSPQLVPADAVEILKKKYHLK